MFHFTPPGLLHSTWFASPQPTILPNTTQWIGAYELIRSCSTRIFAPTSLPHQIKRHPIQPHHLCVTSRYSSPHKHSVYTDYRPLTHLTAVLLSHLILSVTPLQHATYYIHRTLPITYHTYIHTAHSLHITRFVFIIISSNRFNRVSLW